MTTRVRELRQIDVLHATASAAVALAVLLFSSPIVAGAWGIGVFENDDAVDWALECAQSPDVSPVAVALNKVLLGAIRRGS